MIFESILRVQPTSKPLIYFSKVARLTDEEIRRWVSKKHGLRHTLGGLKGMQNKIKIKAEPGRSLPPDHDAGTVCQQMSVGPTSQSKLSAGS